MSSVACAPPCSLFTVFVTAVSYARKMFVKLIPGMAASEYDDHEHKEARKRTERGWLKPRAGGIMQERKDRERG